MHYGIHFDCVASISVHPEKHGLLNQRRHSSQRDVPCKGDEQGRLIMLTLRKLCIIFFLFTVFLFACAPPTPFSSSTNTPRPGGTENPSATNTPAPASSSLKVEKEALRGVQVH